MHTGVIIWFSFLILFSGLIQEVISSKLEVKLSTNQANTFLEPRRRVKRWWLWSKESTKRQEANNEYYEALSGSKTEENKEEQTAKEPTESR